MDGSSPRWGFLAWLERRPVLSVLATVGCEGVLLGTMLLLAPDYGLAQTARDVDAFRAVVEDPGRLRYGIAAVIDLVFALGYAVLSIVCARLVPMNRTRLRRTAITGALLVTIGAGLDEAENVALLVNIVRFDSIEAWWVSAMRTIGLLKYASAGTGAAVVVGSLVALVLTRPRIVDRTTQWISVSWLTYGTYVWLIASAFAAAALHVRILFWVLVPALFVCGSLLTHIVRVSRGQGLDDFGPPRTFLAIGQFAGGVVVVVAALGDPAGNVSDGALFVGIALSLMSLGAFVSELRTTRCLFRVRGPLLIAAGLVCVAAARGVDIGLPFVVLVVLGLVTGEIGTEFTSEWYSQSTSHSFRRPFTAALALLLVTSAILLSAGMNLVHLVVLIVVLSVFVWMALADGDALAVVGVLVLLLIFATRPTSDPGDPRLDAKKGTPYILVLGDSYTSGEGADVYLEGTNEVRGPTSVGDPPTNECRRAPTAWPFLVARAAGQRALPSPLNAEEFPSRVLFLACSGAVSEDITAEPIVEEGQQAAPGQLALYEQVEATLGPPALVVVGVGGNDAGFGDIGGTCVGPGNCAELAEVFLRGRPAGPRVRSPKALEAIGPDLTAAYARIREAVDDGVPIVATGYPIPVEVEGDCWKVLLEKNERAFVAGFTNALNDTIRNAATSSPDDVEFLDLSEALVNRKEELCSALGRGSGLNFIAFASKAGQVRDSLNPKHWIHNSLHPNATGHEALAEEALRWFNTNWSSLQSNGTNPRLINPPPATTPPNQTITDLLEQIKNDGVTPCEEPRQRSCDVETSGWTKVRVAEDYDSGLAPLAALTFALALAFAAPVRRGRADDVNLWGIVKRVASPVIKRLGGSAPPPAAEGARNRPQARVGETSEPRTDSRDEA